MVDAWLVRGYMTPVERANARKQKTTALMYDMAEARVDRSPRLRKYKKILLSDGYASDYRHLCWVVGARVSEIEGWAQQIKEDSDG